MYIFLLQKGIYDISDSLRFYKTLKHDVFLGVITNVLPKYKAVYILSWQFTL